MKKITNDYLIQKSLFSLVHSEKSFIYFKSTMVDTKIIIQNEVTIETFCSIFDDTDSLTNKNNTNVICVLIQSNGSTKNVFKKSMSVSSPICTPY